MPEEVATDFLQRLWAAQTARGLNDRNLAFLIGVTPGYISKIKRGSRGRRLSLTFVLRAIAALPELAPFLSSDLPIVQTESTIVNSEGEPSQ